MAADGHGYVDFGPKGFVARFEHEQAIVDRIKTIQRHHWDEHEKAWVVPSHWPSARRLLHIASDLGWRITEAARLAEAEVKADSEQLPYCVDVVHDNHGQAWFQCQVGDDDELAARVRALPGAYWDDGWWVPTDWESCCGPLLEIVEAIPQLECSPAAWRLLTEPDVSHLYLRSSAPPRTPVRVVEELRRPAAAPSAWTPTPEDLAKYAQSSATQADDFAVSEALRGTLLPFQIAGVRYLLQARRAFLADNQGLGKTAQALAALETAAAFPALILCPADLISTWQTEAERWLPSTRTIASLRSAAAPAHVDVLITSYAVLPQCQADLCQRGFAAIVADESHYLKNQESRRTQAAIAIASTIPGLRLCLSATPMSSKRPVELTPQLAFLGMLDTNFGGFWPFAERYCAPEQTEYGTAFGAANLDELGKRLRALGWCGRQKAAVWSQLPAKTRHTVSIRLEDRAAYDDTWNRGVERLRAMSTEATEATEPTKPGEARPEPPDRNELKKQAYLGFIQTVLRECGRQKVPGVARWMATFVQQNEPLIVFAQHPDVIAALQARFPQAAAITGKETPAEREHTVRAFQSGETQLLLCSLSVTDAGSALTRAAHVAFAELSWKAGDHMRAEDRVLGIGRERPVTISYLTAEATLDHTVLRAIERRRQLKQEPDESVLQEISKAVAETLDKRRKPRVTTRRQSREETPRKRARQT